MAKHFTLDELIKGLEESGIPYNIKGDKQTVITGVSPINNYRDNTLTLCKYDELTENTTRFKAVICKPNVIKNSDIIIECENPKAAFGKVTELLYHAMESEHKISDLTKISPDSTIGKNVAIGAFSVIEENCTIGDNVIIETNVHIHKHTNIGNNTIIKSGAVIGGSGFGFGKNDGKYDQVYHLGGVEIGENVYIGSNTCIDRGTIDNTIIENGVKIDNLCHIAHNVKIEHDSLVIANTMIGGSTLIKQNSYIAPSTSILNQLKINENSIIGMGAVVLKDVEPNSVYVGNPAVKIRERKEKDNNL